MKKEKSNKIFWILIGIGCLIIIVLLLLGNIITIGDKLAKVNKYLAIAFYVLSILLIYFLVFNPLRIIIFSPTFKIPTTVENDKNKRRIYRKVITNLKKGDLITSESKEILKEKKNDKDLYNTLEVIYNKEIKKKINKIIFRNARTVLISTAVSQNGKLDMFTVLSVNLKMIKEIVKQAGFRPSYTNLGKLSLNVLTTALISEGLENLDLSEIFPNLTTNAFAEIPFLKIVTASIAQGISNAFLTLRIGIITRKYLFADSPIRTKKEIRLESFKESAQMIPLVIKNSITAFPEKIRKIFIKKEKINKEV